MLGQRTIDGFEFARAAGKIEGRRAVAEFARLRDFLTETAGFVEYSIRGVYDEHGRPALRVAVNGFLQLRCQRCLGNLGFTLGVDSQLILAATQGEIDGAADSQDRVLAAQDLDVVDLVEDELLLAVPYAPRHAQCDAPGGTRIEPHGVLDESPFAGLRGLLDGGEKAGRSRRR